MGAWSLHDAATLRAKPHHTQLTCVCCSGPAWPSSCRPRWGITAVPSGLRRSRLLHTAAACKPTPRSGWARGAGRGRGRAGPGRDVRAWPARAGGTGTMRMHLTGCRASWRAIMHAAPCQCRLAAAAFSGVFKLNLHANTWRVHAPLRLPAGRGQ